MIKYTIDKNDFYLPSTLNELPFRVYALLDSELEMNIKIKALTNLPLQIIDNHIEQLSETIYNHIEIVLNKDLDSINTEFKGKSIGQFIDMQNCINDNKDYIYKAYPLLIAIDSFKMNDYDYTHAVILSEKDMSAFEVISKGNSIVKAFTDYTKKFLEPLKGGKVDEILEAAGYQEFSDNWGFYNVMYELCKGDVLKFEDFTKLEASTVFVLMLFEKDKRGLEENYQSLKKSMKHE